MAFEKGNEFWRIRAKDGRDKIIKDTKKLAEDAEKYFKTCIDNPLEVEKVGFNGLKTVQSYPMVFQKGELARFCGVSQWRTIEDLKEDSKDFLQVVTQIEDVIKSQKFRYGMIGVFNSNIVARDLGMKERTDMTTNDAPLESNFVVASKKVSKKVEKFIKNLTEEKE